MPPSLAFDVAALLGCGVVTGVGAVVDRAGVAEGSSVVVVGTGGVGLNSVQGAAHCGARADRRRRHLAGEARGRDALRRDARGRPGGGRPGGGGARAHGGRGADYVFVTVGRGDAVEQALACVRRGGTLVVVGMPPSGETFGVVAVDLAHNDVRILGSKMGSARLADAVPRLVELYEEGRLKLDELISGRYPLERINEAIAAARGGDGAAQRDRLRRVVESPP